MTIYIFLKFYTINIMTNKNKKNFHWIINIILLIFISHFILNGDYLVIMNSLQKISKKEICILIVIGSVYYFLQCFCQYFLIRNLNVTHALKKSFDITALGFVGNATTSSLGTIPLQSYYWYKCNESYCKGLSISFINMIFHKVAVCFNLIFSLYIGGGWIKNNINLNAIKMGGFFNFLLIVIMCFLISNKKFSLYCINLFDKIFDLKKFKKDIENIFIYSKKLTLDFKNNSIVMVISMFKMFVLCSIPYVCFQIIGLQSINYMQSYVITSIVILMSSILPSVSGMGPVEGAFLLYFIPFSNKECIISALILFRITSYFLPLFFSLLDFIFIQKNVFYK